MESQFINTFLLSTCNDSEKNSYIQYINGNISETQWIEKVSLQRDCILLKNLKCSCGKYIHVNEKGRCYCDEKHSCENIVYNTLTIENCE